jgi:hypothetical protein
MRDESRYILCKMREGFFEKRIISNQRLLAQCDQVLSVFRVHFIEAMKKKKKEI